MRLRASHVVALLACLAVAVPLLALQRGSDPLTGAWTGDWGPSPGDRNTVNVELKWDGKVVTGVVHSVHFQRPDVKLQKSTFDAAKGLVHMEADAPSPSKGAPPIHYVIEGKLANGSI